MQFQTTQKLFNPNEYNNNSKDQNDSSKLESMNDEKDISTQCPAAQDLFAAHHIEKSCAKIASNSGYNKVYSNAISLLANVTTDFIRRIAMESQIYTEHAQSGKTDVDTVMKAVDDAGYTTSDLLHYMRSNKSFTMPALPVFPVSQDPRPSKLSEDAQNNLCQEFGSVSIAGIKATTSNAEAVPKQYLAKPPTLPKKKFNAMILPTTYGSMHTKDIFDQLHNDKRPFDVNDYKMTPDELKLLTIPPILYETSDDMEKAVKPPSYWEKLAQNENKCENNYNWVDKELLELLSSSDSEFSQIDGISLSPRPKNDPFPIIRLGDIDRNECAKSSESLIRKNAATTTKKKKEDNNNNTAVAPKVAPNRKRPRAPVKKATSNIELQEQQPKLVHQPTISRAKSTTNFFNSHPVINVPKLPKLDRIASKTSLLTTLEFPEIRGRLSEPSSSEDENEIQLTSEKKIKRAPVKKRKINAKGNCVRTVVAKNSAPKTPRKTPLRRIKAEPGTSQSPPVRRSTRVRVTPERYVPNNAPSPSLSQLSIRTGIENSHSGMTTRRTASIRRRSNLLPASQSKVTTSSVYGVSPQSVNDASPSGIKMILRRATNNPTAEEDYEVVFCSTIVKKEE